MQQEQNFLPCDELLEVLAPAYAPCVQFKGACSGIATWNPGAGFVPRGFIGGFGRLEDIELVLLVAEPGNPKRDERHVITENTREDLQKICAYVYHQYLNETGKIQKNIRYILNICWPELDLHQQLEKTWIAETYLCSAPKVGGRVEPAAERACAATYLDQELRLLEGRTIVALGDKAKSRSKGASTIYGAFSVSPPGANQRGARPSWDKIPTYLGHKEPIQSPIPQSKVSQSLLQPRTVAKPRQEKNFLQNDSGLSNWDATEYLKLFEALGFENVELRKKLKHKDLKSEYAIYFNSFRYEGVAFTIHAVDAHYFQTDLWEFVDPRQEKDRARNLRTVIPKAGFEERAFRDVLS